MSEIPKEAIEAIVEPALFIDGERIGPLLEGLLRTQAREHLGLALPFLRRQFEDEHPVLAVIERALAEGRDTTVYSYPPDRGRIVLSEGSPRWAVLRTVDSHDRKPQLSLDECAQQLLANWPEKT
jgi:hypothetical protein